MAWFRADFLRMRYLLESSVHTFPTLAIICCLGPPEIVWITLEYTIHHENIPKCEFCTMSGPTK